MLKSLLPLSILLAFSLGVTGCDQLGATAKKDKSSEDDDDDAKEKKKKKKKKSEEEDEDEEKPKATSKPAATSASTAAPTPQPTETATAQPTAQPDTSPTATGSDPPTGPNGRSAVPTLDEWSKVGEVTVLGSSKLDCETKKVREWIRISCRGESRERGKPTGVTITHGGGRGDTFTFASTGVASLIYPYFQGQHLEATFTWERARRGFKAEWPHGAPQPTAYGIFEGGDAHLR
jgi:hypothetical protein